MELNSLFEQYFNELKEIRKLKNEKNELVIQQINMAEDLQNVIFDVTSLFSEFADFYKLNPALLKNLWINLLFPKNQNESVKSNKTKNGNLQNIQATNNSSNLPVTEHMNALEPKKVVLEVIFVSVGVESGNAITVTSSNEVLFYNSTAQSTKAKRIYLGECGKIYSVVSWKLSPSVHGSKEAFVILTEKKMLRVLDSFKFLPNNHQDFNDISTLLKIKLNPKIYNGGFILTDMMEFPLCVESQSYLIYLNGCVVFFEPLIKKIKRIFHVNLSAALRSSVSTSIITEGFKVNNRVFGLWKLTEGLYSITYCSFSTIKKGMHLVDFVFEDKNKMDSVIVDAGVLIEFGGSGTFLIKKGKYNIGLIIENPFKWSKTKIPELLKQKIEILTTYKIYSTNVNDNYLIVLCEDLYKQKKEIYVLTLGDRNNPEHCLISISEHTQSVCKFSIALDLSNNHIVFPNNNGKLIWLKAAILQKRLH